MFFNRTDAAAATASPTSTARRAGRKDRSKTDAIAVRRRRALAVTLAAQIAVPAGVLSHAMSARAAGPMTAAPVAPAAADTAAERALRAMFPTPAGEPVKTPSLSGTAPSVATAKYAVGVGYLRTGDYEQAITSLRSVSLSSLSDRDQVLLNGVLGKARDASGEQLIAHSDLIIGEQQLVDGTRSEAVTHLSACAANVYAAADVRERATARLAAMTAAAMPIHADVLAQPTQPMDPAVPPSAGGPAAPAPTAPAATAPVEPMTPPVAPPMPVAPPPVFTPPQASDAGSAGEALRAAATVKKIKQQQDQYRAQQLVLKARQEKANNLRTESLRDYTQAALLDPNNREAIAGREEVGAELNVSSPISSAGSSAGDSEIRRQEIYSHFGASIDRSNNDIASNKFTDAQKEIDTARVWRNHDTTLFTQPQLNDFDTTIRNTELSLATAKQQYDAQESDRNAVNVQRVEAERNRRYQQEKQQTVTNLIQTAQQYTEQGKYAEALNVVDNIEKIDPTNQYATGVRPFLQDKALIQIQRQNVERRALETGRTLVNSTEQLIPYGDIIHYPDNWPSLSEERDAEVRSERGGDDEDAGLTAMLDRKLPEMRFDGNGLADVVDFLRDTTGANIYVDWKALSAGNVQKDAVVTAGRLHDVKVGKAMELIFKSVEGPSDDQKLGFAIEQGVVMISTRKELNKNTVTRRYDINDLLFVPPDYNNAPSLDLQNAGQNPQGGGGIGGSQAFSVFSGPAKGQGGEDKNGQTREQKIDEVKKYIEENVDASSWKEAGGEVGSISSSPLRAILLITQTPENQHKVASVLDSLRASQALQVSIECRFLTVQRNYLEDIGVDADFQFNPLTQPGNVRSGYNSSRFSPIGVTQNQITDNTTFRDANGNVVANQAQGSRQLDWISNVGNASIPGSIAANPSDYPNPIVISGSYLDNFTVNFLIRAVEANQNTTNLTAPRLTLFSGQRAVLVVETQQAYVSGLTPVVATGAALFNPQVATTVASGVVLSVQATVSPDRKYVFLDLQPQLARLRALVPFTLSAVVTPVTNVLGGATNQQIIQGTLQLPTIDFTQVQTSVSVPDGATLLLGGQTLAAETVREQGVPVLSKIPFLKRLFTNRATSQDEQILLILVKPTILIQKEQELKAFPSLSSKAAN